MRTLKQSCQTSRIIPESPVCGTNLPVSRTGHQISRRKTTLNLFIFSKYCAPLRRLSRFKQFHFFKIVSPFLNTFLHLRFSEKHTVNESGCVFLGEGGLEWANSGSMWLIVRGGEGHWSAWQKSPDFRSLEAAISAKVAVSRAVVLTTWLYTDAKSGSLMEHTSGFWKSTSGVVLRGYCASRGGAQDECQCPWRIRLAVHWSDTTGRLEDSGRQNDEKMSRNTGNAQSCATLFRHSAVLSLPAMRLSKVFNSETP